MIRRWAGTGFMGSHERHTETQVVSLSSQIWNDMFPVPTFLLKFFKTSIFLKMEAAAKKSIVVIWEASITQQSDMLKYIRITWTTLLTVGKRILGKPDGVEACLIVSLLLSSIFVAGLPVASTHFNWFSHYFTSLSCHFIPSTSFLQQHDGKSIDEKRVNFNGNHWFLGTETATHKKTCAFNQHRVETEIWMAEW